MPWTHIRTHRAGRKTDVSPHRSVCHRILSLAGWARQSNTTVLFPQTRRILEGVAAVKDPARALPLDLRR